MRNLSINLASPDFEDHVSVAHYFLLRYIMQLFVVIIPILHLMTKSTGFIVKNKLEFCLDILVENDILKS